MKKIILGLFYMLATIASGSAKASTPSQEPNLAQNNHNTNIQKGVQLAGCAFDNRATHQNKMNKMRNLLQQYMS